jgi:hypothetical protein
MTPPLTDPQDEAHCLARSIMPNGHRPLASVIAGALVLVWLLITMSLTLEGIEAVAPPYYGIFTALVFLLVGRLWGIERELMEAAAGSLPISIDLTAEDSQDDQRDD